MRTDSRRLTTLLVALFVCAFGSPVHADSPQVHELEGVRCSVGYNGPDLLHNGFFPIQVELLNGNDHDVVVDFEAEQEWQTHDRVIKRVRLAPGEQAAFEPLLRARFNGMNSYSVKFTVNGERRRMAVGPSEWSSGHEVPVLYCSARAPEAGSLERWAEQWSDHSKNDYNFASNTFGQLSGQWPAYTCYEWVIVSLDEGMPPTEKLDALFAWARTGGRLVIHGDDPRAALSARPQDSKWFTDDYRASGRGAYDYAAYHFGHGSVVLVPRLDSSRSLMETVRGRRPEGREAIGVYQGRTWTPGSEATGPSGIAGVTNTLGGFGELPLRGLMVLLVVFALVMGPVNFWWVKRSRKPMLLLLTVPGISIVTSLGLALFGIISQGLDVKVSASSFTFLDQPNRTATTAEVRRIFAGSSPGAGLRPEAGTMVFPADVGWQSDFRSNKLFTQDLTDGRVLSGDFIPVRKPTVQLILSDRPTRLRLEVTALGEEVEVANALGGQVEDLLLRDLIGDYHSLQGPLPVGVAQRLSANVSLAEGNAWSDVRNKFWSADSGNADLLPRGSYIARVRSDDLRDDCGVVVNELSGTHVVFGVYDVVGGGSR